MRSLSLGGKPVAMWYDWTGVETTRVHGDAARVRQVMTNLLANAIKFTQQGHVALCAELLPNAQGHARALLRIEDTGPGIDPSLHERIFEAFVQGDASLTRQHGGSGLGLAIARRIARAMGGDVRLERSDADGSCFVFEWPTLLVDDVPRSTPAPAGLAWIVDPRREGAQWLQRRLVRLGWRSEILADVGAADAVVRGEETA